MLQPRPSCEGCVSRVKQPPSTARINLKHKCDDIADLVRRLRSIAPEER